MGKHLTNLGYVGFIANVNPLLLKQIFGVYLIFIFSLFTLFMQFHDESDPMYYWFFLGFMIFGVIVPKLW